MIPLSSISHIGRNLDRPESVLCTQQGDFFVSHRGHGISRICADGRQLLLAPKTEYGGMLVLPNGIALRADGSFLVANISDAGGIFELDADGIRPFLVEINGRPCPPINFVTLDEKGRLWFSVSSTLAPRHLAYRRNIKNGYVGVIENGVARIVLDGLHYTNEIRPDLENDWLYVSETFGQYISRFRIMRDGSLGEREIFAQFPSGGFVDGIALDDEGGIWAACIVSNELYHIPVGGSPGVYAGERNIDWVSEVEQALDSRTMDRSHFDQAPTRTLRNIASVAFYGSELDRLVCGNLLGNTLVSMDVPVMGRKPIHWDVRVPVWGEPF